MTDIQVLKTQLEDGVFDERLVDIYGISEKQRTRYIKSLERYEELFGKDEVEIYSAPGRTEIGGNHTDHQHGMVLAASIDLDTIAVAAPSDGNVIELISEGYKPIRVELDLNVSEKPELNEAEPGAIKPSDKQPDRIKQNHMKPNNMNPNESEYGTTASLIKGVVAGLKERGYRTGGFRAYMTSNVLNGAGLSSSAAFETVIGTILSGLYNDGKVSPVEIAIIGQYAENVYFGKPCGLMDQMACSIGGIVHIDFQNPAEPIVNKVDFDLAKENYSLCIVDTKGSHADLTDDYAKIPEEMKTVAAFFGKEVLREVPEQEFHRHLLEVRKQMGDRNVLRAIHFFVENRRVQQEVDTLQSRNFAEFLQLVKASGDSSYKYLQNIYSNHQEQNQPISVGLAVSESVLGADGVSRVHGGGFAGTIQAFVRDEAVADYKQEMEQIFGDGTCHVLRIRKYGGIKVV